MMTLRADSLSLATWCNNFAINASGIVAAQSRVISLLCLALKKEKDKLDNLKKCDQNTHTSRK